MKITDFSVKNYQFTLIVFVMLIAIGINSLMNMPRGEDPDFQAPQFNAIVIYPGTSPQDMEQLVVDPMEKKLNEMDDVKRIISKVDDGLAVVRIDFKYETDPDKKYQDLVRELDAIKSSLPKDILSIDIMKFSPSDVNILQVGLVSETAPYKDLEHWSKQLKEDLEKIKSLKNVDNWAFPQQEVRIALNLEKMAHNKIPLNRVMAAIQSENVNIPGGSVDIGQKRFNIKTSGDYKSIAQIQQTIVNSAGGKLVYVKDMVSSPKNSTV
jgi:multidrug efflux pump subunit AcrB